MFSIKICWIMFSKDIFPIQSHAVGKKRKSCRKQPTLERITDFTEGASCPSLSERAFQFFKTCLKTDGSSCLPTGCSFVPINHVSVPSASHLSKAQMLLARLYHSPYKEETALPHNCHGTSCYAVLFRLFPIQMGMESELWAENKWWCNIIKHHLDSHGVPRFREHLFIHSLPICVFTKHLF